MDGLARDGLAWGRRGQGFGPWTRPSWVCAGNGAAGVDHPDRLTAQPAAQDRRKALLQGRLEDQVFVRVDRALHYRFAQAVGGGQQHRIAEAGFGVDAEHHPGGAQIGAHHALHPDREGHLQVVEAVQDPIGDGPIGEQGGVATPAGGQQVRLTGDVQKSFLLAGKAGLRQVFSGGTGAHRHRNAIG